MSPVGAYTHKTGHQEFDKNLKNDKKDDEYLQHISSASSGFNAPAEDMDRASDADPEGHLSALSLLVAVAQEAVAQEQSSLQLGMFSKNFPLVAPGQYDRYILENL